MRLQSKKFVLYSFTFFCILYAYNELNGSFQTSSIDNIVIKDSLEVIENGNSTIGIISKKTSKLVAVYDSTLCTSCQVSNLFLWNEFASMANDSLELSIIFVPNKFDYKIIKEELKKMQYSFPVYIDSVGSIYADNPLYDWSDINNHFFLLDENQNISIKGFPLLNDDMKGKYKKKISKLGGNV